MTEELQRLISDHFFPHEPVIIASDTQLFGNLLDSAQVFELVELLEQSFDVAFRSDHLTLENLSTIDRLRLTLQSAGAVR